MTHKIIGVNCRTFGAGYRNLTWYASLHILVITIFTLSCIVCLPLLKDYLVIGERRTVEDTFLNRNNIYTAVCTCTGDLCVTITVLSWDWQSEGMKLFTSTVFWTRGGLHVAVNIIARTAKTHSWKVPDANRFKQAVTLLIRDAKDLCWCSPTIPE